MKRRVVLTAVLAAAVLLVAACGTSGGTALTDDDDDGAIEISAGDQFTVALTSNPSTGFSWVVADAGPVTQVGEAEYEAPEGTGVVGAAGTQTFTFTADDAGTGDLVLEYRRPWETGVDAEDTWSVTVTVK